MSRRAVVLIAAMAVALGLALWPWPVTSTTVRAALARQIRDAYGLKLGGSSAGTFTLLPVPRLKLQDVELADGGRTVLVAAAQLKAELRVMPLFLARLRIAELRIAGAKAEITVKDGTAEAWHGAMVNLRERIVAGTSWSSRIERLAVTGSELVVIDAERGTRVEFRDLAALARWPDPAGDLDLQATARWNGEAVTMALAGLNPSDLMSGRADAIEARLSSRLGGFTASGVVTWAAAPRFAGPMTFETPSLRALSLWTGFGRDLRDLDRRIRLDGQGSIDQDGIAWPRASLDLAGDRMEGAIACRFGFGGTRPQVGATLAGEDLDLSWVLPLAVPGRSGAPEADYDVRLSASGLRLGQVRLEDAALGILVSSERLEVSLGRAMLAGGSVRGRLVMPIEGDAGDIRGNLAVDKVDVDALLSSWDLPRAMTGLVSGQAAFDLPAADRHLGLSHQVRGRVTLRAREGEILGLNLVDGSRRADPRPGAVPPGTARGGRMRYGTASVTVDVADGVAEIAEGLVETSTTQTHLSGHVSLADRTLSVRTVTRPASGLPDVVGRTPLVVEIKGPVFRPVIAGEPEPVQPVAAAPRL